MSRSRLVTLCVVLLTLVPLITSIPTPPSTPRTVTYDANGYKIDGRYRLLRGGSLQWFRIPPTEWRSRMQMLKDAGCNIIDMYVAWNQHERVQNVFDFTTHNVTAFLDLAIELDMFIYIRPGPYITNEMDGGGVPNWVFLNSTKRTIAADGRPNLRTEDPEWLDLCRHWLSAFNAVIAPYQYPRGGPIIFYAIENEYNWFRQFFLADKLFWYDGQQERGLTQEMNPNKYLTALRDIVKSTGIEVPLTSCPGDGYVTDMGDVPDVLPMPNFYTDGTEEHGAYRVVSDMHDPSKFAGVYVNMPSGASETWRDPIKMKRMLMGGFDLFISFNLAGLHNEGYINSLTMDINLGAMFDVSSTTWQTAFVSPTVSYYHTMVDFYGIISPSGALRAHFSDFHRTNMLLNDFESVFASGGLPWRSIDSNAPVKYTINNAAIGAKQDNKQVHYYRSMSTITSPNCYWLEIVNEQKTPTVITTGQITFGDLTFPQYVPLTVTTYNDPSRAFQLPYAMFIPIRQSIYSDPAILTLTYTTSEILTLRDFNGERLLVLYGPEGTQGELSLTSTSSLDVILSQLTSVRNDATRKDFTYTYKSNLQTLTLRTSRGIVRIIITTLSHAGRIWFVQERDVTMMIAGLEQVTNIRSDPNGNAIFDYLAPFNATAATRFTVTSPKDVVIAGHTRITYDVNTLTYTFSIPSLQTPIPSIPSTLLSTGLIAYDMAETQRTYDDSDWISWEGDAKPIEALGVNDGHFWYRVAFNLNAIPKTSAFCNIVPLLCGGENDHALNGLYVEHASDIIGIYINGKYITTLLPLGGPIHAASINQRLSFESFKPYLIIGRNVISFRVEQWGHGSFMFPRGNLLNSPDQFLPAAGFDSWRGLWGPVKMGKLKLTSFTFRPQLGGERNKAFTAPNAVLDMSKWKSATLPLQMQPGDIVWYKVTVPSSMLPDGSSYRAPLVLEIKGRQAKATIYFNGVLIGRWLSDQNSEEKWMSRGTWAQGARALTEHLVQQLDYDTFPMDRIERQAGGENVFSICFEDVSVADPKGYNHDGYGRIDSVRLKYNQEIVVGTAGSNNQKRADNIRAQGSARITTSAPASSNAATLIDPENSDTLPPSTSNDSSPSPSTSSLWMILVPVIVGSIILLIVTTFIIRRYRSSKHVTTITRVTRAQSDPIGTELTTNPVASMDAATAAAAAAATLHTPNQV